MTYLTKTVNGINDFLQSDGTGDCMDFISKAPHIRNAVNKNNRYTSVINNANRRLHLPNTKISSKRQKRIIECGACRFYLGVCVTDHREYSLKCPQKENPNHIKNPQKALQTKMDHALLSQNTLSQLSVDNGSEDL